MKRFPFGPERSRVLEIEVRAAPAPGHTREFHEARYPSRAATRPTAKGGRVESAGRFSGNGGNRAGGILGVCFWVSVASWAAAGTQDGSPVTRFHLSAPFVVTQLPIDGERGKKPSDVGGMIRRDYGEGARLVIVYPDFSRRILSEGFHSACDPDVSFDGTKILFAGKRKAADSWSIYEIDRDGTGLRRITGGIGDCRSPGYQPMLYTIISPKPWYQLTFVGTQARTYNEYGPVLQTDLFSCKLDGSALRRLTFNLSSDFDPFVMLDGRLIFSAWQRATLERGFRGRVALFGVNIDGADYAVYCADEGRRIKHMPCATTKGLVVFVETEECPWDGAGSLGSVSVRRPLHSYRPLTEPRDGLFMTPSPLPDGSILVSRRPADGSGSHGVYRFDPESGEFIIVFDDPRYHDIQGKLIHPRREPDGRSSVVTEKDPYGKFYCLNVYITDLPDRSWLPPGTVKRLRVLEGIPIKEAEKEIYLPPAAVSGCGGPGSTRNGLPPLVQRRILGDIPVEKDGSFHIKVPADTPVLLQTLDSEGLALRTCGWIWAKNHEPRGCIGCHEDNELTPENRLVSAVTKPEIPLTLPPERRRTVDFRRDVASIIASKCVSCHGPDGSPPRLDGGGARDPYFSRAYRALLAAESPGAPRGKYVHPGRARTSPLVWHIVGRNTARPWDGKTARRPFKPIPGPSGLTEDEKLTFIEWIDMGALWDGIPGSDEYSASGGKRKGGDE